MVASEMFEKQSLLLGGVALSYNERPCCQRLPVSTRFHHYISNKVVVSYSVIELRRTCKFIVSRIIEGLFVNEAHGFRVDKRRVGGALGGIFPPGPIGVVEYPAQFSNETSTEEMIAAAYSGIMLSI